MPAQKYVLMLMISGFIILKDVLKQGYPFVEAIASALPICDEFLIAEGTQQMEPMRLSSVLLV